MKNLLILFALLFSTILNAQYKVEWNTKEKECSFKGLKEADDIISLSDIAFGSPVTIQITNKKNNVRSLTISYLDDSGDEKERELHTNDEEDSLITINIDDKGKLEEAGGFTKVLAYPYHLKLERSDLEGCSLTIGKKNTPDNMNFYLFKNVDWSTHIPTTVNEIIDNIDLDRKNVVMLIDCSPRAQSKSILYRLRGGCKLKKKRVRYLLRGDYLKVYLYNINRYKYQVEINDVQEDFSYGRDSYLDSLFNTKTTESRPANAASLSGTDAQEDMLIISMYAAAVDSMKLFISYSKNQSSPSSNQLEYNKQQIETNLVAAKLLSSQKIEELYNKLKPDNKEKIKKDYEKAKQFSSTLNELRSLSYTLEGILLPIQVKSYDQLKLTVTLKDKNGNVVGKPRDYIHQIIGGIKVDQSFGFVGHSLLNQEFSLRDKMFKDTTFALLSNGERIQVENIDGIFRDSIASLMDITKKEILNDKSSSQISLGITTFTHFYYRLGFINIGPQIGFSVDIFPEQNIRYLAGGSIMFTDGRHRVSLNFGVAFGKVKQLSAAYEVGDFLDGTNAAVPLVDKRKKAWYFGISYNVPLVKKKTQLVN